MLVVFILTEAARKRGEQEHLIFSFWMYIGKVRTVKIITSKCTLIAATGFFVCFIFKRNVKTYRVQIKERKQ